MITLASIDIPTVNIRAAIPGSVSVAPNDASTDNTRRIFHINAKFAIDPDNKFKKK